LKQDELIEGSLVLKSKKRIRIIAAACVVSFFACLYHPGHIHAAAQNPATHAETSPPTTATQPGQDAGAASYAKHCAVCHGEQREGNLPGFPPLMGINRRLPENQISELVHKGKGRMPGFPNLQDGELSALLHYLTAPAPPSQAAGSGAKEGEARTLPRRAALCFTRTAHSATAAMPWEARRGPT
jgi:mono/diheme cytochrome c family protein